MQFLTIVTKVISWVAVASTSVAKGLGNHFFYLVAIPMVLSMKLKVAINSRRNCSNKWLLQRHLVVAIKSLNVEKMNI